MTPTVSRALSQIAGHPRCHDLARLTRDCLFESVGGANLDMSAAAARRAAEAGLSRPDAELDLGNLFDALAAPATYPGAAVLLGTLAAYALALEPPEGVEAEDATVVKLAWLGAYAGVDTFAALDAAMGERASGLWGALADLLQRHDARGAGIGRAEALIAAAALASSENPTAVQRRTELASTLSSPMLAQVLGASQSAPIPPRSEGSLAGELASPPRGPVATFFLGLFGWLLVSHVARLIGRFALQYRRPAEVSITTEGIKVRSTTKLLGKTVRESETVIPIDGLARATREVRFPRLGTYAGLVTLVVGSFVGVSWFIDGIRSSSLSIAIVGVLIVLVGVALDFAFVSLLPGRKGRCRLVFVPRRGSATCLGWVDAAQADALLKGLQPR